MKRYSLWLSAFLCLAGFNLPESALSADTKPAPGLVVTYKVGEQTHLTTAPNVWLHVESGKPATPFLPGGKLTTTWEGAINADLRGNFIFQADLNGALKVEINGTMVLEATGSGGASRSIPHGRWR